RCPRSGCGGDCRALEEAGSGRALWGAGAVSPVEAGGFAVELFQSCGPRYSQKLSEIARVLAGSQVYGERNIAVSHHVPTYAMKCLAFNAGNLHAFGREPGCFPRFSICAPGSNGVMPGEEQ